MGGLLDVYRKEPLTEKESTDETNGKLICGASCMQGWRPSQEDAHNTILDFDENASFFAVYDGHGGHEVAQYCAQNLPEFIKNLPEYKNGKLDEALISGFLQFDATLTTPDVINELKNIAKERRDVKDTSSDEDEDEENVDNLYKEAAMPIEQVIEKYRSPDTTAKQDEKKDSDCTVDTSLGACSSSTCPSGDGVSSSSEAGPSDQNGDDLKLSTNGPGEPPEKPNSSDVKDEADSSLSENKEVPTQNGQVSSLDSEAQTKGNDTPVENSSPSSKKGKGKAVIKPEPVKTSPSTRPKRDAVQLYQNWLDGGEESDSTDEEDQTFEGPNSPDGESSEDDDEGVNVSIDGEEESSEEGEDEEEDDHDSSDEEEGPCGPGATSGCTAVVALLKGNQLYVANAGDSRCIICRKGKAVNMSKDHKPETKTEKARITKAGGEISTDGRIDGGLNLSRAIGDHSYKNNKNLSDREQKVIALPDIRTLTINPSEDEFIVLACDGIWNSLSSQEVVDFVRPRIKEGTKKLSEICEEMFDSILSPNTFGDGSGCDNMTAIIVQFKSETNVKRSVSPPQDEASTKRTRIEDSSAAQANTTV